jgi:hypothetical protein
MTKRLFFTAPAAALLASAVTVLCAQSAPAPTKAYVPVKTADGQPDLRGTWVNFDSTPFEAPPPAGGSNGAPIPSAPGINPPSHWADHDSPMKAARRSMVIDPPDGRVPVMKWAEDKRAYDLDHVQDHWTHQTSWERCITRGMPAGMFPAGYNNAYEFIQVPGYVVIRYEMIHNARIIPIDGRPRLGEKIKQWDGEPRGHWDKESNTLIVESTNYNDKGMIATSAATQRIRGIPQTEALHVVETFRPVDANTIIYRATIDDKNVYTKPWTVEIPLTRDPKYRMFEYSCQEGNYATPNILAGGRAAEREAARGTKD